MVVSYPDVMGALCRPPKHEAPLIVDSDRVEALQVPSQLFLWMAGSSPAMTVEGVNASVVMARLDRAIQ